MLIPYSPRSTEQLMSLERFRNDALGAAIFGRQLEQIDVNQYNYVFENLIAETLFPSLTLEPGIQKYTWRGFSPTGLARVISDYADDIPRADILGEEQSVNVQILGASWGLSAYEIDVSNSGRTIDFGTQRAIAARNAILQKLESISAVGDTSFGLYGIGNQPNGLTVTLAAGAAGGATTRWDSGKTAAEMLNDLNAMVIASVNATKGQLVPDTIIMNNRQRYNLTQTPMSGYYQENVLNYFLGNNQYIKTIVVWEQLTGAGSGGTDRMIAFKRDPQYVVLATDAERQTGPQQKNLVAETILTRRTAGIVSRYPLAVVTADGA